MYKAVCIITILLIMIRCTTVPQIWYSQTIKILPHKVFEIEVQRSSAVIHLKNISYMEIKIVSELKTNGSIQSNEAFQYHIPKKGKIKFMNPNNQAILITYSIESSNQFKITINQ